MTYISRDPLSRSRIPWLQALKRHYHLKSADRLTQLLYSMQMLASADHGTISLNHCSHCLVSDGCLLAVDACINRAQAQRVSQAGFHFCPCQLLLNMHVKRCAKQNAWVPQAYATLCLNNTKSTSPSPCPETHGRWRRQQQRGEH